MIRAQIDHASGVRLQALGRVVGQFGQGLGRTNTDPHRDTGALQDALSQLATDLRDIRNAGHVSKGFIDAVHLDGRDLSFDQAHHPLTHVAVQRVVRRERHDPLLLQLLFDLEIRRAHFDIRFGVITAGNDATVIVAQHHDRHLCQVRPKHALTACIKAVAVNQGKDRPGFSGHGCAPCG